MTGVVQLRDVLPSDLEIFFRHQLDPEATRLAAFPARDRPAFMAHWTRILADRANTIRTILIDGEVAGNIVAFQQAERQLVGYWVGRDYWGQGIATQALTLFLHLVAARPIYAFVAKHNPASIRVLQKCGFVVCAEDLAGSRAVDDDVEEVLLRLEADGSPTPG
ncbi:MAG: GNAT family N-acetyltransferase [Actinomycetota bacterium]